MPRRARSPDQFSELPWSYRLRSRNAGPDHPRSLDDLRRWIEVEGRDPRFRGSVTLLSYLDSAADWLRSSKERGWSAVYAVGPLIRQFRPPASVPFVVILMPYARVLSQLLGLGDALAPTYMEHGILPDLHVVRPTTVRAFERRPHPDWIRTLEVSVQLA
jgi:hypothetical protein